MLILSGTGIASELRTCRRSPLLVVAIALRILTSRMFIVDRQEASSWWSCMFSEDVLGFIFHLWFMCLLSLLLCWLMYWSCPLTCSIHDEGTCTLCVPDCVHDTSGVTRNISGERVDAGLGSSQRFVHLLRLQMRTSGRRTPATVDMWLIVWGVSTNDGHD